MNTGEKFLPIYTLSEVRQHCEAPDCWIIIFDRVYDVTSFILEHPGGSDVILEYAGRDATLAFLGAYHGAETIRQAEKYCVGVLVEEEKLNLLGENPKSARSSDILNQ